MPPKINITPGMQFGMWTVTGYAGASKWGDRLFHCRCDCGRTGKVASRELHKGNSKSCGCAARFTSGKRTHGQSGSKLYKVWTAMKRRCSKTNDISYHNYGGRGITVCDEWQNFEHFYKWAIKNGYAPRLTIERTNNDKGYYPDNCTWIPKPQQSCNTRHCKNINYRGEIHNIMGWAKKLQIPYSRLQRRLKKGWEVERAFTTPLIPNNLRHPSKLRSEND